MSMWTGASDALTEYLAQREVERQRELVNATALQERAYQRQRDVVGDERAARTDARLEQQAQQAAEDRKAALAEAAKNNRYRNAVALRETLQPGLSMDPPEEKQRLDEFNLGNDLYKKIALPVATLPSQPAQVGGVPMGEAITTLGGGTRVESLGGTDYQAKQREIAARQEAAAAAALERADRLKEQQEFTAGQNALARTQAAALANLSNDTRLAIAASTQAARGNKPASPVERQALAFYNRAQEAERTLTTPSQDGTTLEDRIAGQGLVGQLRGAYAPNVAQTDAQQAYTQAQRAFTEARLRKESGAAISESEIQSDRDKYFAKPGDSKATVEQKRKSRQAVLDGLKFSSGKAYQEFYGDDDTPSPSKIQGPPGTPKVTIKAGASLGKDW